MRLVVAHYHLRPGGVRRVIELATPYLIRAFNGKITRVTLASGEAPDRKWRRAFDRTCGGTPVEFFVEPAFGYFSEQRLAPAAVRDRNREALCRLLGDATPADTVVWAHNLGLARNLIFTQELARACELQGLRLLAHHHDWWFDNRWARWPEARRAGCRSIDDVARVIFGSHCAYHVTINEADATILQRHMRGRVAWLPNLNEPATCPPRAAVNAARAWLRRQIGDDAPVWLLPCRLLRRKNIAEALLLTRWLRPEAWLVTLGGVSSAEEQTYYRKLKAAARGRHWRLRLGVLAGDESRKPSVPELLAASEALLLTSMQEGFGLPYLEAAAGRRPLIARALPNIAPDLARFGFRFPQCYEEIRVSTGLFDWKAEHARQTKLFRSWLSVLPATARRLAGKPGWLARSGQPDAVPFSRLTLTAQLEVLAQPIEASWESCLKLNPFLATWRQRASARLLQMSPWPRGAARWLSGESYGRRFRQAFESARNRGDGPIPAAACQKDFVRQKLEARFLYPVLWSEAT